MSCLAILGGSDHNSVQYNMFIGSAVGRAHYETFVDTLTQRTDLAYCQNYIGYN